MSYCIHTSLVELTTLIKSPSLLILESVPPQEHDYRIYIHANNFCLMTMELLASLLGVIASTQMNQNLRTLLGNMLRGK